MNVRDDINLLMTRNKKNSSLAVRIHVLSKKKKLKRCKGNFFPDIEKNYLILDVLKAGLVFEPAHLWIWIYIIEKSSKEIPCAC